MAPMTDDEQIARCTELARRVWPDLDAAIVAGALSAGVYSGAQNETMVAMILRHPRALNALEAALLVLADDGDLLRRAIVEVEARSDLRGAHAAEIAMAVLRVARGLRNPLTEDSEQEATGVPPWVEQLATAWEREARGWIAEHHHDDDEECDEHCNAEAKQVLYRAAQLRTAAREAL